MSSGVNRSDTAIERRDDPERQLTPKPEANGDHRWVERYFDWRIAQALPPMARAGITGLPTIAAMPPLSDPVLDTVDVAAIISALRREVLAQPLPSGLRLSDREPGRLPASPEAPDEPPAPTGPAPAGLGQLLRQDGKDFIYWAYMAVLGRPPDWSGLASYLQQLHGSQLDKIAVLRSLSSSAEGRASSRRIFGLGLYERYYRMQTHPMLRRIEHRIRSARGKS
jgi:Domain of unknown function (DUF4214)